MSDIPRSHDRIISAIQAELWAITPDALNQIIAIAQGYGDMEAVVAKLGRPLPNTRTITQRDNVAIIPVDGPIFRRANLFTQMSGATSVDVLATDLTTALENPSVDAIVQVFGSPGGMVAGISEYAQMVRDGSRIKPIISYVGDMAASAALWIAAAGNEVVLNDTAAMGSLGVVLQGRHNKSTDTWEIVSAQSPLKRLDPGTPEGKAALQSQVDAVAQIFVERMAEYRGVTVEKVLADFGQGGMLIGQAAVDAGLADRIGSLESIISTYSRRTAAKPSVGNSMSANTTQAPVALTLDQLKAEHSALYEQIKAEGNAAGLAAGLAEGAATERARIEAVYKTPLGAAHKDLIAGLMFDGKSTGADAALAVLAAEQGARDKMRDTIRAESPAPLPHATAPEPSAANDQSQSASGTPEERAKANWDKDANLRAEFGNTFSRYLAYFQAAEAGQVRVLGAKR